MHHRVCELPFAKQLAPMISSPPTTRADVEANAVPLFAEFVRSMFTELQWGEDIFHDTATYHIFTASHRLVHVGRLSFISHLETFEADMRAMLGEVTTDVPGLLQASPALASMLLKDVKPRYRKGAAHALEHENWSPETRRLVEEHYRQDFACFHYDPNHVDDLEWHKSN